MTKIKPDVLLESIGKIKDIRINLAHLQKGLKSEDEHVSVISFAAVTLIYNYLNCELGEDMKKVFTKKEYPY